MVGQTEPEERVLVEKAEADAEGLVEMVEVFELDEVEGVEGGWRLKEAGWSYCDGHPAPGFSVTEVDLSPPRPGQELDVHVKGVTPRRVSGGRILIRAKVPGPAGDYLRAAPVDCKTMSNALNY